LDYRIVVKKEIENYFDSTDYSVGEILRNIISEKLTGIVVINKSRFTEISDEQWYKIIEDSFKSIDDKVIKSDEEFELTINKMVNNEQ